MTDSECWLLLFFLFSMNPDAIQKSIKKEKQKEEMQRNCPYIEWEQDMGAHIPFCRLTNDFCNYHCMQ